METIKDYLRSTEEFANAYMRLKALYREMFAYMDSLDLVNDYMAIDVALNEYMEPLYVLLNDDFVLVGLKDCNMVIDYKSNFFDWFNLEE